MRLAKSLIHKLSNQIQSQKLVSLNAIHRIWDNLFLGNHHYAQKAQRAAEEPIEQLFMFIERYKIVEQLFSCIPILIAIPMIIIVSRQQVSSHITSLGALVAVLPRSLQLLQNIHSFCTSLTNVLFLHNKINNLSRFVERLPKQSLISERVPQSIMIDCLQGPTNQVWTPKMLLQYPIHLSLPQGRFLITGSNGSGKSSLLRHIKQKHPEAVLWGPDIVLGIETLNGSIGEKHRCILLEILKNSNNNLLLLDEWDASLDQFNTKDIDQQLNELALIKTIFEVRH